MGTISIDILFKFYLITKGAIRSAVIPMSFMKIRMDGPATSFIGSPTVSPNDTGLMLGRALHALLQLDGLFGVVPCCAGVIEERSQHGGAQDGADQQRSQGALTPNKNPMAIGTRMLMIPGRIICLRAFFRSNVNAPAVIGGCLTCQKAFDLPELSSYFIDHQKCSISRGGKTQRGNQEG